MGDEDPSNTSSRASTSSKVTFDQSVEFRQRTPESSHNAGQFKTSKPQPPQKQQAAWKKIFTLNRRPTKSSPANSSTNTNSKSKNKNNNPLLNDDMRLSFPEDERISANVTVDHFEKGRKAGVAAQQLTHALNQQQTIMTTSAVSTDAATKINSVNNNNQAGRGGILRRSFNAAATPRVYAMVGDGTKKNATNNTTRLRPNQNQGQNQQQHTVNLKQLKVIKRNSNSDEDCVCVVYTEDNPSGRGLLYSLAKRKGCRTVVAMAQELMDHEHADDDHAKFISELKEFDSSSGANRIHICAVQDYSDVDMMAGIIEGCSKIFFLTKHWEKFSNDAEETIALNLMKACYTAKVPEVILCTFEDSDATAADDGEGNNEQAQNSQLMPQVDWSVCPTFAGMSGVKYYARTVGIRVTHMITLVRGKSKRMLNLIAKDDGSLQISADTMLTPASPGSSSPVKSNAVSDDIMSRISTVKQQRGQNEPIQAA